MTISESELGQSLNFIELIGNKDWSLGTSNWGISIMGINHHDQETSQSELKILNRKEIMLIFNVILMNEENMSLHISRITYYRI